MISRKGLDRVVHLVRGIVRTDTVNEALALEMGWKVEQTDQLIVLHPVKDAVDLMYFRKGDADPYVVQIPHAKTELHLEAIAPTMFDLLNAKALWLTQVKRTQLDSAHLYYCDMNAATAGAAQANPELIFLSVHGFAASPINRLWDTDIIVSGGTWWPTARAHTVYRRLKWRYRKGNRTVLFPWDVPILGGTTNVQGQLLRSLGNLEHFLHFELSQQFRALLREDANELAKFSTTLQYGLRAKPDEQTLRLTDPWQGRIGRMVRRKMPGADMLAHALGLSPTEFQQKYGLDRAKMAHDLGVTLEEVNYYLDEV